MIYRIWVKYPNQRTEPVDQFTSKKDADFALSEYQMAFKVDQGVCKVWLGKKSEEPQ